MDVIEAVVDRAGGIAHAVVIGAVYIGLEMAQNLHERGIAVQIVEMADQIMPSPGLGLGPRGGIAVDVHMRTSDPDVYAAGTVVWWAVAEIGSVPGAGRGGVLTQSQVAASAATCD